METCSSFYLQQFFNYWNDFSNEYAFYQQGRWRSEAFSKLISGRVVLEQVKTLENQQKPTRNQTELFKNLLCYYVTPPSRPPLPRLVAKESNPSF